MAFKIDPLAELARAFSKRAAATIVGLTTVAKALSPGMKIRLAAAFKAVASALERQAKSEAGAHLSKRKRHYVDAGVDFYLVPEAETPVIKSDVAAQKLPRDKHHEAWGTSKTGGNVKITVGPLYEE